MKWFKHETDARTSERMARLKTRYGMAGVGRWWTLLEIVGERMDDTDRCHAEYPVSQWEEYLSLRGPKLIDFLRDLESIFPSVCVQMTSICHPNDGQMTSVWRKKEIQLLRIDIPKLLKKRDNYTRNLQATDKKVAPRSRLEVEEEEDKIKNPPSPLNPEPPDPEGRIRKLEDLSINESHKKIAAEIESKYPGMKINLESELAGFVDYCWQKGYPAKKVYADYSAGFRTRIRNIPRFSGAADQSGSNGNGYKPLSGSDRRKLRELQHAWEGANQDEINRDAARHGFVFTDEHGWMRK